MKTNKLLLLLNTSALLALPTLAISCSNEKQEETNKVNLVKDTSDKLAIDITNSIEFNTYSISVFDTISSFSSNPIKITNLKDLRKKGINVRIIDSNINFEKEEVEIKVVYSTKNGTKDIISIPKPFKEFKWVDSFDKERIFSEITKFTVIQWMGKDAKGKDLVRIKNKYAVASDITISPYNGEIPSISDISYNLTLKGIKDEFETNSISSSMKLKGGIILYKEPINIKLNIDGKEKELTYKDGQVAKPEIKPTKEGYKFLGWSTSPTSKSPDIFVNGEKSIIFEKDAILYAVFKKLPKLSIQLKDIIFDKYETHNLVLDENGILQKIC